MSQHPDGYWGMHCFNALSPEQQRQVVEEGYLEIGWKPEGTVCDRPAELEIETKHDRFPGPRFYCLSCAIQYLEVTVSAASAQRCTGVSAVWCPIHGDCTCPDREELDDPGCPLHAHDSTHGYDG